jgi:hypothetical protein
MNGGWKLERRDRDGRGGTASDDVGGGISETNHDDDVMLLSFELPPIVL